MAGCSHTNGLRGDGARRAVVPGPCDVFARPRRHAEEAQRVSFLDEILCARDLLRPRKKKGVRLTDRTLQRLLFPPKKDAAQ